MPSAWPSVSWQRAGAHRHLTYEVTLKSNIPIGGAGDGAVMHTWSSEVGDSRSFTLCIEARRALLSRLLPGWRPPRRHRTLQRPSVDGIPRWRQLVVVHVVGTYRRRGRKGGRA